MFKWGVENAIKACKSGKTPEIDGISMEIIRKVWRAIPWWMKKKYGACLREKYFPSD